MEIRFVRVYISVASVIYQFSRTLIIKGYRPIVILVIYKIKAFNMLKTTIESNLSLSTF